MSNLNVLPGAHVRIRYATIVNYAANALSLGASLLFAIIIARKLTTTEFGIWGLIFSYINYIMIFANIYTYWLPRTISRGFNTALTGIVASLTLGTAASGIYLLLMYGASTAFNQPLIPLLLSTLILFENYVYEALSFTASGYKPEYVGVGSLVLRVAQSIFALIAVAMLRMGLLGAVLSAIAGRGVAIAALAKLEHRVIFGGRFEFKVLKTWLGRAWLPIYNGVLRAVSSLDVLIVFLIVGVEEPIAYFTAIYSILNMVYRTIDVQSALYPRILAKRSVEDVEEVFWLAYVLTIPIVVGGFVFAPQILSIYNPRFVFTGDALRVFILSLIPFFLRKIYRTVFVGFERGDVEDASLLGSALFEAPTIWYLVMGVYLAILTLSSIIFKGDVLKLLIMWGVAFIIRDSLVSTLFALRLRQKFGVSLPLGRYLVFLARFGVASLPIVVFGQLVTIPIEVSIYRMIWKVAGIIIYSASAYFAILYLIDKRMREIFWRAVARLKDTLGVKM